MTTEILRDKVEFISDRDSGSNSQAYFQIVKTYGKFANFSILVQTLIKINVNLNTTSDDFDSLCTYVYVSKKSITLVTLIKH